MHIHLAASTDLFVGTEQQPLQVVRATIANDASQAAEPAAVTVGGEVLSTPHPADLPALSPGQQMTVEVGVAVDGTFAGGTTLPAEIIVRAQRVVAVTPLDFVVAEPGWRMFMVSHFHYDPVWWNTQAAYTEEWEDAGTSHPWEASFQGSGLTLVAAHLDMARRDPDYRFVLAELDYLKPYWDVHPQDREWIRTLLADGRLELIGGTYNEANTNLVSAENTARNAVYGIGYQRDVVGGRPRTAWQLDVFGHDPQFPALMAAAGLSSSSFARGPFHEWGPNWYHGDSLELRWRNSVGGAPLMQFPTEFDWVARSGASLLTCYMANHYSAGWWMDASTTLAEAQAEAYRLFRELKAVAATRNVLLPVGTDYSPPNRWVTAIQRDWNARYVWPRLQCATAADFFAAVRDDLASSGRRPVPQTRDMNPIYTGKDVSYIDTKQMHRDAERTLLAAEAFATFAALLGARYPAEAIDKAWRQLIFNAHHDGITGAESDQVYLDLLGGWREAYELAHETRAGALAHLGSHIDTRGDGLAITVFNPMSWRRTDVVDVELTVPEGWRGVELRDEHDGAVPCVAAWATRRDDGALAATGLAFVAEDVPGIGYRTYRAVPADDMPAGWEPIDTTSISNDHYLVEVDPARGGAISRLRDTRAGKELLTPGGLGNELLAYDEYAQHPHFAEGPWHLAPTGVCRSASDAPADVRAERGPAGLRLTVTGRFEDCAYTQQITLWDGIGRVDLRTHLDGWARQDTLFRLRFAADVEGGMPVCEVAAAVIGRGFALPDVDVAEVPFTLDNPCANWFALGATARIALGDRASRAISIAEVIVPEGTADAPDVRRLVTALVRQGVTSTLSQDTAPRYGRIAVDSNLPDVRIVVGCPADNAVTTALLGDTDAYAAEFARQAETGAVRMWVPAERPLADVWQPNADLRGLRDLPALIVAGDGALEELVDDLADAVVEVTQPAELDGATGHVEPYGVAVLNRGTPGFAVDASGAMHVSLMRSCSGWPSGIWIDPPRRTLPTGGNFQFQHWSHTWEHAVIGHPGDWREGDVVRAGHDHANPLIAQVFAAHDGALPATAALLHTDPEDVVVTAVKPAGNPMARMAGTHMDPRDGIVVRAYEPKGRPARVALRSLWPLRAGAATDVLEDARRPLPCAGGAVHLDVEGYGIATTWVRPDADPAPDAPVDIGPRAERAQPVFADYWRHNRGVAPMGYQPVTVQIVPTALATGGPFTFPVLVASERTDAAVPGRLRITAPPGWAVDPPERLFRLAPGAYLEHQVTVTPPPDTRPGRYFVAATITDDAGQAHEDVMTVDVGDADSTPAAAALAIDVATRKARVSRRTIPAVAGVYDGLAVELMTDGIRVTQGEHRALGVVLRNGAAAQVRGEAQLLSPYETWPITGPWTQGFAVPAEASAELSFTVDVPAAYRPGTYWALVKVMYFGRRRYSEAIPLEVVRAD